MFYTTTFFVRYNSPRQREIMGTTFVKSGGAELQPFQSLQKQYCILLSVVSVGFQKSFFLEGSQ